jgi:tetratricopeptide (TPR) repeat protein
VRTASVVSRRAGEFVKLANACGFGLTAVDLVQLGRRKFLEPIEIDGEERYVGLHLYVLAQYFEVVRPVRHPWATVAPERTLDQIGQLGRSVGPLAQALVGSHGLGEAQREQATNLLIEMERYINEIDPFGPIAALVDLMRGDVIERLRGSGRLYAEIRAAGRDLADLVESRLVPEVVSAGPVTMEVAADANEPIEDLRSTQVIETTTADLRIENVRATSEITLDAREIVAEAVNIDEPETGDPVGPVAESGAPAPSSDPFEFVDELVDDQVALESGSFTSEPMDDVLGIEDEFDTRATQVLPPAVRQDSALEEESSEPIMLLDDEVSSANAEQFHRNNSEVTSRNEHLARRLHQLRQHDEAVATVREKVQAQEHSAEELVDKIADLNRLREAYLKDQAWQELADLYENGIGLFVDPTERQQVYRVLATLYESKLGRTDLAMGALERSFLLEANPSATREAWDGLRRLGSGVGQRDVFATRLESLLAQDLSADRRQLVQRTFAMLEHDRGESLRAFMLYTSLVLNDPSVLDDAAVRNELEELLEVADDASRQEFFDDLLRDELSEDVQLWAQTHVGW